MTGRPIEHRWRITLFGISADKSTPAYKHAWQLTACMNGFHWTMPNAWSECCNGVKLRSVTELHAMQHSSSSLWVVLKYPAAAHSPMHPCRSSGLVMVHAVCGNTQWASLRDSRDDECWFWLAWRDYMGLASWCLATSSWATMGSSQSNSRLERVPKICASSTRKVISRELTSLTATLQYYRNMNILQLWLLRYYLHRVKLLTIAVQQQIWSRQRILSILCWSFQEFSSESWVHKWDADKFKSMLKNANNTSHIIHYNRSTVNKMKTLQLLSLPV